MPLLVGYLLKFSIAMAVAWSFYQLALRRLTFYSWNRWYLLGYTALCLFIPFIDVQHVVEKEPFVTPVIIRFMPGFRPPVRDHSWDLVLGLLAAGSLILMIRLILGWLSVRRMRRRSVPVGRMIMAEGTDRLRIYELNE